MDVRRTVRPLCEARPFPQPDRPPSTVASNPIFEVTSSPPTPSEQVTRPAVAMVISHNQSQDEGGGRDGGRKGGKEGEGRPRSNHKDNSITPRHQLGCAPAISHPAQHFCSTRFNHPFFQMWCTGAKGKNTWLWLWIPPLTACSGEQSLCHRPVTVSQLEWRTGHLAANSLAMLSARKRKYVKGVITWWLRSSFTRYWLVTTSWSAYPFLVLSSKCAAHMPYINIIQVKQDAAHSN